MNFDIVEGLNDEDIINLYNQNILDISNDKLACHCSCNGRHTHDVWRGVACTTGWSPHSSYCGDLCHNSCVTNSKNWGLRGICTCRCDANVSWDPYCTCV